MERNFPAAKGGQGVHRAIPDECKTPAALIILFKPITRLTQPNEFAMPNGILLSPDGKTLYINNCYDDETWYPVKSEKGNFIWAYDVNADGTISNSRKFAKLLLTENVLDRKGMSSSADGMAIDKQGNIYVATFLLNLPILGFLIAADS
ncbi:MAG: SMP-30/gluconolactonase/LRE family protein [Bacteroidota bacterium]|nr:SMP-30/gluconolactonase/LRE family protein [Bacteroidota bacterium]